MTSEKAEVSSSHVLTFGIDPDYQTLNAAKNADRIVL